ncbi:MAG: S-adenosylmethionine:tRNA ribosyltransferase-isomerase, partial [Chitinophagaceae bacterium]|nr:S-adenosylmethionine:tRNA ribosyltransferase-isomerase [Chitinophagaceae bacterium]
MKKQPENILIKEFDYPLSNDRIARYPCAERDQSKLLVYDREKITDAVFADIATFFPQSSTLVLNDSKVIEARIFFQKATGGVIEVFCLEPHDIIDPAQALMQTKKALWKCLIGGASKWKRGQVLQKRIEINGHEAALSAKYINKEEDDFVVQFEWQPAYYSFAEILHMGGTMPLPPYIKREVQAEDLIRYQ